MQPTFAGINLNDFKKGDKPSELPVQAPVKFELVINLKAATGLGLTELLGLADK